MELSMAKESFNLQGFLKDRKKDPERAYTIMINKAQTARERLSTRNGGGVFKQFVDWLESEKGKPATEHAPDDVYLGWQDKIDTVLLAMKVELFLESLIVNVNFFRKCRWINQCMPNSAAAKRKNPKLATTLENAKESMHGSVEKITHSTIEVRPYLPKDVQRDLDVFRRWLVDETEKPFAEQVKSKELKQKARSLYVSVVQCFPFVSWRHKFWCQYYRLVI